MTLKQVYHKSLFIKCGQGPGTRNHAPPQNNHTHKKGQLFSPAHCCPKSLQGWLPSKPQWKETIDGERTPTALCFLCTQCPLRHSPPSSGAFEKTKRNFPIPLPIFSFVISKETHRTAWRFCGPLTIHKPGSGLILKETGGRMSGLGFNPAM